MKTVRRLIFCLATAAAVAFAQPPGPNANTPLPFVSPIFGDDMMLQRGKVNTIWGWSDPGDTVRVEVGGNSASATAGANGRWQVQVQPPAAGGPYTVKISGKQTVELKNVLVGDVWIAAGQSNMQFGLGQARGGAEEIKNANYPQIRYYVVGQRASYKPVDVPRGNWRVAAPENLGGRGGGISAAAYFFAKKVHESERVPVGIVQAAVGGVPAETFTSIEALRTIGDFDAAIEDEERRVRNGEPEHGNYISHWYDDYDIGEKEKWADPALDDAAWEPVQVPSRFEPLGIGDASLIWIRKAITLPETLPQGNARVYLGQVDKMDTVFVNGRQIGASSWVENPRAYSVPAGVLKPGRNVIAIRLFRIRYNNSFLGKPEELRVAWNDGPSIPLAGDWRGKVSVDARPPHPLPFGVENNPTMPGILYRGMLAPVAPLAITGAIWYQGESNAERAYGYRKLLPAMIGDWRNLFGQGDFPFYIVGLPFYKQRSDVPVADDSWAEMREAMALVAKNVPNACLATTIDTGNADDVHPIDKKEVGERLGLCALANHYKRSVPYSGPTMSSVERMPGALKVRFDHTEGGLVAKGGRLAEFSIAGEDGKWYWADARIEGDAVIVSSSSVARPTAVRYAWQANPSATLFNGAGLPAVPFRTDDWAGLTQRRYFGLAPKW